MKKIASIILVLFILSVISCSTSDTQAEQETSQTQVRDGVFVHVSHGTDDPHRVLMALQMARIMSETRDVLVYFDITGIEVVLKEAEDITFSHFPSSHTQIKYLLDNGITLMACPGCLKAAGKTSEDLISGIQVADKDQFFNFTGGRILTIDY